jgi:hypothetical protein
MVSPQEKQLSRSVNVSIGCLHVTALLPHIWLFFVVFMLSGLTAIYTPSPRAWLEVTLWAVPEALTLSFWLWAAVYLWGPKHDGRIPDFTRLHVVATGTYVVVTVALLGWLLADRRSTFEDEAFVFFMTGPFVLCSVLSAIGARLLRRFEFWNIPWRTSLVGASISIPAAIALGLLMVKHGDSRFYYDLPLIGCWAVVAFCVLVRRRTLKQPGGSQ